MARRALAGLTTPLSRRAQARVSWAGRPARLLLAGLIALAATSLAQIAAADPQDEDDPALPTASTPATATSTAAERSESSPAPRLTASPTVGVPASPLPNSVRNSREATRSAVPTRPDGEAYPLAPDQPADYALDGGYFYSQAVPGAPRGFGFSVSDSGGYAFWTEYLRHGGVESLGYPISRRFRERDGWTQVFQGGVLRWRVGDERPELILLDEIGPLPAVALAPEPPRRLSGEALKKPWSGWWWPATSAVAGPHLFDSNGPLAKYDLYVARDGRDDPRTLEWEQAELWLEDLSWAGHCNGWAAASLLEPEPTEPRQIGLLSFSVGDQKGLLSAWHFADSARWLDGDEHSPLSVVDFHRRLIEWLGLRGKGFVLTFRPEGDEEVWSYPVYRFELLLSPASDDSEATLVSARLWLADNDVEANFVGTRPWLGEPRTYSYRLSGPLGKPTGGEWVGASAGGGFARPSSVWYPDSEHRNLGRTLTSPSLDYRTIQRILKGKG